MVYTLETYAMSNLDKVLFTDKDVIIGEVSEA